MQKSDTCQQAVKKQVLNMQRYTEVKNYYCLKSEL